MRETLQRGEVLERRRGGASVPVLIAAGASIAACDPLPEPAGTGSFSGQVVVSGPLRGARVSVDEPAATSRHPTRATARMRSMSELVRLRRTFEHAAGAQP
jgi:hypothetical protein